MLRFGLNVNLYPVCRIVFQPFDDNHRLVFHLTGRSLHSGQVGLPRFPVLAEIKIGRRDDIVVRDGRERKLGRKG
ncbi:hypothetical protein AG1IA_04585 [Rhizoctonia solani AG-1 IA]|uniref:Uncharacterized protein n=1 Tax=Thanatephorus cucumeris (strain AG1-IA) TaxID=983506 RepID=L8WX30_THACA|nr:hypothetical protein AG1IA_04585 [Rhizoctonia solani AG-1 IA]